MSSSQKHTVMLPPMSDLTRAIAAPNLSVTRKVLDLLTMTHVFIYA